VRAPTKTAQKIRIRGRRPSNLNFEPQARVAPSGEATIEEILARLEDLPGWNRMKPGRRRLYQRGTLGLLTWLAGFPGQDWQERWMNADANESTAWLEQALAALPGPPCEKVRRDALSCGIFVILAFQVVLPGYGFLLAYNPARLLINIRRVIDPDTFAQVDAICVRENLAGRHRSETARILTKIVLHTGKNIRELSPEDLLRCRAWHLKHTSRAIPGLFSAWDMMVTLQVFPEGTSMRAAVRLGQLTTGEMVDRYRLKSTHIRDLLVRYLEERRPSMDFSSFRSLITTLIWNFWADLEAHHPGIDTIDLPDDVTLAWKERLHHVERADGTVVPRAYRFEILIRVRAFYLDLQEWALDDPSGWAEWAVRSPVRRRDIVGFGKQKKVTTARIHQRTRERLPHLPVLVETAEQHLASTRALLATATATPVSEELDHEGQRLRRIVSGADTRTVSQQSRPQILVCNLDGSNRLNVTRAETDAFWAWAIIETLRLTGVRIEELLEITHLALISYTLPDTGEIVPLLQIVPSKSNEERVLLVTPELASVLASVIHRIRGDDGRVPVIARYDPHELTTGPPLPHLFQRRIGLRPSVIGVTTVERLLAATLARTGLTDAAGQALRYTPHDFRRMFATDAVTGGLPVHIAARLLGHANLATTQAYLAVFNDDLIRSYRAFINERRAIRPSEEYREPTDSEWTEFNEHFALRKVELGTCGRPYGTPCNHEHACIRCPMLRVDPKQRNRLAEIVNNLTTRITEATDRGWHGELQGFQVSLDAARAKLASLDRTRTTSRQTLLGLPTIRSNETP
jgi:hypothetical protein